MWLVPEKAGGLWERGHTSGRKALWVSGMEMEGFLEKKTSEGDENRRVRGSWVKPWKGERAGWA